MNLVERVRVDLNEEYRELLSAAKANPKCRVKQVGTGYGIGPMITCLETGEHSEGGGSWGSDNRFNLDLGYYDIDQNTDPTKVVGVIHPDIHVDQFIPETMPQEEVSKRYGEIGCDVEVKRMEATPIFVIDASEETPREGEITMPGKVWIRGRCPPNPVVYNVAYEIMREAAQLLKRLSR